MIKGKTLDNVLGSVLTAITHFRKQRKKNSGRLNWNLIYDLKMANSGANSLVVSASTYSATVLMATRVRFPSRGPLPILLPSLHPMLSCRHSTVLSTIKKA